MANNTTLNHDKNQRPDFQEDDGGFVSEEVVYWMHVVAFFCINCPLSLTGICANIINITVFIRQGVLSDSSNTTLLGLALVDFWCLLTIFNTGVFFLIYQEGPDNPNWDVQSVMLMTSGWPHVMFSQMACWITAYLAFERCICVTYPFKVKTLFSAKQSLVVLTFIYLFTIVSYCPVFVLHSLGWVDDPGSNRTIFTIDYGPYSAKGRDISDTVNSLTLRTIAIAIVIVCTQITVIKVNSSNKWRKTVTSSTANQSNQRSNSKQNGAKCHKTDHNSLSKNENSSNVNGQNKQEKQQAAMSQKDTRMVRMVVTISFIFLACYTPDIVMVFTRLFVTTLNFGRKLHNLMIVCYWGSFFAETINSSINIIVYYRLSSRYKEQFRKLFGLNDKN